VSRFTDKDHGYAAFVAQAKKLAGKPLVKIGVLDDGPKQSNGESKGKALSLLEVAAIQEYGCSIEVTDKMRGYLASQGLHLKPTTTHITIPARSFIRGTADEKESEILALQKKLGEQVLLGKIAPDDALDMLGMKVVAMVRGRIAEGISPPLRWFTINRKKSSKPLVSTGQLRKSVTHRVEAG
jgi:hypothetical protein